jgi:arylsulfatase A-like enzyme
MRLTHFFTPRGQTAPSLCSTLVGRFPSSHGVRDNGMTFVPDVQTLFELVGKAGFESAAFVSRFPVSDDGHPARGADLFVSGAFDEDGELTKSFHRSDEIVLTAALEWLNSRGPSDERPFLAWVHFFGLHKPYAPPPPYDQIFVADDDSFMKHMISATEDPWEVMMQGLDRSTLNGVDLPQKEKDYVLGIYDGALRAVDERVGRVLERLTARGLCEDTLVMLTSDHGEELGDHNGYWFHGNSVYDSALHIPLIVRWPGKVPAGESWDGLAQNVDLTPTLLDWFGLPIPPEIEGVSLVPWLTRENPPPDSPRSHGFVEWQDVVFGVRTRESKLLLNPLGAWPRKSPFSLIPGKGFRIECEELYDLESDPGELVDLIATRAELAATLRPRALAHRQRPAWVQEWAGAEEGSVPNLEALGYVGTTVERDDVMFGALDCGSDD